MKRALPALIVLEFLVFPVVVRAVAINEFLAHPSTGNPEWVEFYNDIDVNVLKTYYIDDDTNFASDSGSSAKQLLTGLNTDNVTFPYFNLSSVLNNGGDFVVLFDGVGNIVDQLQYVTDPGIDKTIGRSPDQTGSFITLDTSSRGAANVLIEPSPSPTPTIIPEATLTPTPTEIPPTPTIEPTTVPTIIPTVTPTSVPEITSTPTPFITNTPTPKPREERHERREERRERRKERIEKLKHRFEEIFERCRRFVWRGH